MLVLVGFADAGREIAHLVNDEAFVAQLLELSHRPDDRAIGVVEHTYVATMIVYGALLAIGIGGRLIRAFVLSRRPMVTITYPGGQRITVEPGTSILEASRRARIPHASVCGGRGRCSTCRVHVAESREEQPAPSDSEREVLQRVGASPATRLACQLRPVSDLAVTPLLAPDATARDGHHQPSHHQGGRARDRHPVRRHPRLHRAVGAEAAL
ncbi:MAG: (2Fe-2S)-binding protein [Alphaproteobacteria bacterium]|nr:(2Fe-2S)-binding protein [Alphaproteobacteria bacterium]